MDTMSSASMPARHDAALAGMLALVCGWREICEGPDGQQILPETRLGRAGSETERRLIALLFGHGGSYGIPDPRARAAMLNLLEAEITLMTQDLNLLVEEGLIESPEEG